MVPINYPERFRLPITDVAVKCEWRIERVDDSTMAAPLDDPLQPGLLVPHSASSETESGLASLDLSPLQSWQRIEDQAGYAPRIRSLMNDATSPEVWWGHARNLIQIVPSADLTSEVALLWARISTDVPGSSMTAVTTKPAISWRNALLAGMLTHQLTPERLQVADDQFVGFEAGRGMTGQYTYGVQFLIEPFFLSRSPRILGMPFSRVGGILCILFPTARAAFGEGQGGRRSLDLLHASAWPAIDAQVADLGEDLPSSSPALLWWLERVDVLLSAVLDPRRFIGSDGVHDPVAQTAQMLNVVRLFTTIQSLLAEPITNTTARLALLFDALDIFETCGLGGYDVLCHPATVNRELERLAGTLPPETASILLPKCERAAAALARVREGFFCGENIDGNPVIRTTSASGATQLLTLDSATSRYLRLLRDARHGFAQRVLRDPTQRVLYGCHQGELPAELADLAFLHLVRVLANPHRLGFARDLSARSEERG